MKHLLPAALAGRDNRTVTAAACRRDPANRASVGLDGQRQAFRATPMRRTWAVKILSLHCLPADSVFGAGRRRRLRFGPTFLEHLTNAEGLRGTVAGADTIDTALEKRFQHVIVLSNFNES